jgi:hypothetical protein
VRLEVLPEEEAQRQRERQERYGIYSTLRFPEWKMPQNIPFKEIFHNERFVHKGIDRYFRSRFCLKESPEMNDEGKKVWTLIYPPFAISQNGRPIKKYSFLQKINVRVLSVGPSVSFYN